MGGMSSYRSLHGQRQRQRLFNGYVPGCTVNTGLPTEDLKFKLFSLIFFLNDCWECRQIIQVDPLLRKLPLYQSISFILSTFHEMWMISPYLQQVLDSLPDSAQSKHELPHMDNKLSGVSSGRSCISNLWFCYPAANVSSQRLHDHVRRRCSICRQCRKMNFKKKIYKF